MKVLVGLGGSGGSGGSELHMGGKRKTSAVCLRLQQRVSVHRGCLRRERRRCGDAESTSVWEGEGAAGALFAAVAGGNWTNFFA